VASGGDNDPANPAKPVTFDYVPVRVLVHVCVHIHTHAPKQTHTHTHTQTHTHRFYEDPERYLDCAFERGQADQLPSHLVCFADLAPRFRG
jgi:hypothetical protein